MKKIFQDFLRSVTQRATTIAWVSASFVATVSGPFGTFGGMNLINRSFFWGTVIAVSIVIALAIKAVVRNLRPDLDEWSETLAVAFPLTLIFTPILYWMALVVAGPNSGDVMSIYEMAAVVILVPITITAFRRIIRNPALQLSDPKHDPETEPRLLKRLGDDSGQRILRISVRDHYVEVVTDMKSETLLMRFSDAMAEAEGIPGLQVHRSHWVAEDAVAGIDREKGRIFLKLVDGSRVPVSRGYREQVEKAGIDDSAA